MSKAGLLAIFSFVSMMMLAQSKPVEITSEPGHHLVLQNAYTRVFQVQVPPHASTQVHLHRHSYVFVTLGPAEIENDVQGKAPVKMKLLDGQTELTPGPFAHMIRNIGDTPFRNVTIEILRPPSPSAQGTPRERGLSIDRGLLIDTLYDTAQVEVIEFKLNPGAHVAIHQDKWPHLLVAITDLKLRDQKPNGRGTDLDQKAGDISWSKGGFPHSFTNLGLQQAHWIDVEFK